nr:FimD/PapC N-terminal domain-containing protein [Vibrio cholerae]
MVFKINAKLKQAWRIVFLLSSLMGCKVFASEFNTDVLDADDIQNIDMSQFSVAGYTLPGNYVFTLFVNGQRLGAPVISPFMKISQSQVNQLKSHKPSVFHQMSLN